MPDNKALQLAKRENLVGVVQNSLSSFESRFAAERQCYPDSRREMRRLRLGAHSVFMLAAGLAFVSCAEQAGIYWVSNGGPSIQVRREEIIPWSSVRLWSLVVSGAADAEVKIQLPGRAAERKSIQLYRTGAESFLALDGESVYRIATSPVQIEMQRSNAVPPEAEYVGSFGIWNHMLVFMDAQTWPESQQRDRPTTPRAGGAG